MNFLPEVIQTKLFLNYQETVAKIFNSLSFKDQKLLLEMLEVYGYKF